MNNPHTPPPPINVWTPNLRLQPPFFHVSIVLICLTPAVSTVFILTLYPFNCTRNCLHRNLTTSWSYRLEYGLIHIPFTRLCPDFLVFFGLNHSGCQCSPAFEKCHSRDGWCYRQSFSVVSTQEVEHNSQSSDQMRVMADVTIRIRGLANWTGA